VTDAALLQMDGVSKTFRTRTLRSLVALERPQSVRGLANVTLTLRPGEVAGLLGPNGAGKTTLINVVCDLVRADTGTVSVAGRTVPDPTGHVHRQIGLLNSNERSFFWRLTGRQNLAFFAALHGRTGSDAATRVRQVLTSFGLERDADRRFLAYSTGMRKRLALARALLHEPALLLMDEATNGLDAAGTAELLDLVRARLAASGRAVLWATHRLDEVRAVCDRVVVLLEGRIRFDGSLEQFRAATTARACYRIEVRASGTLRESVFDVAQKLAANADADGDSVRITWHETGPRTAPANVLRELMDRGAAVTRFEPVPMPLHELFANLAANANPPPPQEPGPA
jgi:ABC-2 type transport system ATP-binding protein